MTSTPPSPPEPPRLAERLVRELASRRGWRDVTTGDLREEFQAASAERGSRAARRWYWRETALLFLDTCHHLLRRTAGAIAALVRPPGDHLMRTLLRESRLAVRSLIRQPLVSAVVVLTLALGLGANAATFGWIDGLLLHPFTIPDVDRLVVLSENSAAEPFPQEAVSPANFLDYTREARAFDGIAAMEFADVTLSGTDQPERIAGHKVSGDFFRILSVTPLRGRMLDATDDQFGRHRQVVISEGLWQRRFGGDPSAVGNTIRLDGEPHTVVGIAPPGFDFPSGSQIWAPLALDSKAAANRTSRYLTVVARLRPNATLDTAQTDMTRVFGQLTETHAEANRNRQLIVRTFTAAMVDIGMPQVLALWQAAAVLVLLIGGVNIANLLLAPGASRERELAVRLAIGASRWQIVRQLLVESVILALVATPLAIGVAAVAFDLVKSMLPAELVRFVPGWNEMGVTWRLMGFTLLAALVAAVIFGLLPALQASRPALTVALRDGGRSVTAGSRRHRLRRALVVVEVALALPLLIASGLAATGAQRFVNGAQGYDPDGLLKLRVVLPEATYPDPDSQRQFAEKLLAEARRQPGVEMAATTLVLPSSSSNYTRSFLVDGRPTKPEDVPRVNFRTVSADYLRLMRIPIMEGRDFTEADRQDAEPVAIVSQSLAKQHWPGESALGRRIRLGGDDRPLTTIVGISGDTIDDWFINRNAPTVYAPSAQLPMGSIHLVLRTSGDPAALADGARRALAAVDPNQAAFSVATMREAIRVRTSGLRFIGAIMLAFGVIALTLAAVGIYSVMAFFVAQRRQEMGIRMALGATASQVLRLTLGHGARMAGLGIAIGAAAGLGLARLMESAMFGIVRPEPWLFISVATVLAACALLASLLPARQATRVDPIVALRE